MAAAESQPADKDLEEGREEFLRQALKISPEVDTDLLGRAYDFAARAHSGQKRESGDPFLTHCVNVAQILLELQLGSITCAAGLIHDAAEDTAATIDEVRESFGEEIAALVDGVTKIGELRFENPERQQVENYRKMLLSMARDIRVILIKLADRLHNMRTLDSLTKEQRHRISLETREIYAPLAHRFGMARIKWELEDGAFKYLESDAYRDIGRKVAKKRKVRESHIEEIEKPLLEKLREAKIDAEVTGRPKHFFSIYRKMKEQNLSFEQVYDLSAIRVITATEQDCYHVLGLIHSMWTPVHDRFKDYIATPKTNMYQSLHTVVIGPMQEPAEIQIRTREMDRTAELGIAAHWRYKEGGKSDPELDAQMVWLRQVLDWQKDMTDPQEFMEFLKIDLFQDEVFVFTPKGDLTNLPKGATALDFAFHIHTDIGLHCAGARVNGQIATIHRTLSSGDTVEIITSPNQKPSIDWVSKVVTSRARSKVRQWLRVKGLEESISLGRMLLERRAKKENTSLKNNKLMKQVVRDLELRDVDSLYAAVGRGDVSVEHVLEQLSPGKKEEAAEGESVVQKLVQRVRRSAEGIRIEDIDNLMIHFARCCQPVPGDPIVGFVTRGRGLSIHRADCPNTFRSSESSERRIHVEWDVGKKPSFEVGLKVLADDRPHLLADVAKAISDADSNIKNVVSEVADGMAEGKFIVEVSNLAHLQRVIKNISGIRGVSGVERQQFEDFEASS
ncbi:RelA/SpoT family protein [candidate division KSB1 bacterium]